MHQLSNFHFVWMYARQTFKLFFNELGKRSKSQTHAAICLFSSPKVEYQFWGSTSLQGNLSDNRNAANDPLLLACLDNQEFVAANDTTPAWKLKNAGTKPVGAVYMEWTPKTKGSSFEMIILGRFVGLPPLYYHQAHKKMLMNDQWPDPCVLKMLINWSKPSDHQWFPNKQLVGGYNPFEQY